LSIPFGNIFGKIFRFLENIFAKPLYKYIFLWYNDSRKGNLARLVSGLESGGARGMNN
jgi:hypothetical protein